MSRPPRRRPGQRMGLPAVVLASIASLARNVGAAGFQVNVSSGFTYSRRDMFCPPSSCRPETGRTHLKNVELVRGGHLAFLSSARIASIICRELEAAEAPATAGPRSAAPASRPPLASPTATEPAPSAARAA